MQSGIIKLPSLLHFDREGQRFENLLRRAAELLNRRNCDLGAIPNAQKANAVA